MTTETTVLARWTMDIDPVRSSEAFRHKSRLALAELFRGFARALLDDKDIDLLINHEIELSIVSEHLNHRLMIKLIKMDITEEEV